MILNKKKSQLNTSELADQLAKWMLVLQVLTAVSCGNILMCKKY